MTPKNPLFARIRTHTHQTARYFVRFEPEKDHHTIIPFDSFWSAFWFWLRLKRHPFNFNPHLFRGGLMLDFRDFIVCLITAILAMAAFGSGNIILGVGICIIGTLLAAMPK